MSDTAAPGPTPFPPDYPPMLYVPCVRHVKDPDELEVEYRSTRDGRTALLVYSALDRLHACCGKGQPWFLMPTLKLDDLYQVHPFDTVLLDVVLPDELKKPAGSTDGDWQARESAASAERPAVAPPEPGSVTPPADGGSVYVGRDSLASRLGGR